MEKLRVTVKLLTNKPISNKIRVKEKPVTAEELEALRMELEAFTAKTGIGVQISTEAWID